MTVASSHLESKSTKVKVMMRFMHSSVARGALTVLAVATIGALLSLQGWRSRVPPFDLLLSTYGAYELVTDQRIPDRGALSSYVSHNPPGGAWLMAPGVFLFKDPRLFDYIGSLSMYVGTLTGIVLLARMYFTPGCAVLAVVLYGLSELGLEVAGSVWERLPLHFFYVWMLYFASQWVRRSDSRFLAAAILVWATGMYVFMEIAPAALVLPIIWLIYRPRIKTFPLLVAGLIIIFIWSPYLRFQYTREFADFKSQMLRKSLMPPEYKRSWCDPSLVMPTFSTKTLTEPSRRPVETRNDTKLNNKGKVANGVRVTAERALVILAGVGSNFRRTAEVPGNYLVLLLLVLVTLFGLTALEFGDVLKLFKPSFWHFWPAKAATALLLFALLANEWIVARYFSKRGFLDPSTISTIRWMELTLVAVAIGLLLSRRYIYRIPDWLAITFRTEKAGANRALIVIGLVVPWLILLATVENATRLERLWWLWPLQVVFLAASVTYVPSLFGASRTFRLIGSLALLLLVVVQPLSVSRMKSWFADGWSGKDDEEVVVTDYVANRLAAEHKNRVALGYDISFKPFNVAFHAADHRYKIGAQFDQLLRYRYGIQNTDACAEGIAPNDEYRLVETQGPSSEDYVRRHSPLDSRFQLVREFPSFRLYERF
jgi:Dolichyl-phosphate-mannose-protein mannosyltransferase